MGKTLIGLTVLAVISFWATITFFPRHFLSNYYFVPPLFVFIFDLITLALILYRYSCTVFPPLRAVTSVRSSILPYSLLAAASIVSSIPLLASILNLYGKSFVNGLSYSISPILKLEIKFITIILAFVFSSLYVSYLFFEWVFRLKRVEEAENHIMREIRGNGEAK